MRINRYIASCGYCSRRAADQLIEEGKVRINGRPAVFGDSVEDGDSVTVGDIKIELPKQHTYLAFYKPVGVICTFSDKEKNNLGKYLPKGKHLAYAGRLDVASEGLLLFTNDGGLIDRLMKGSAGHEKEYIVRTKEEVTDAILEVMRNGMHLPGIERDTLPCRVKRTGEREFHITLTQGINRQIRRMCEECALSVKTLKRIRIENIFLGNMKPGETRELSPDETKELLRRTLNG